MNDTHLALIAGIAGGIAGGITIMIIGLSIWVIQGDNDQGAFLAGLAVGLGIGLICLSLLQLSFVLA